MIQTIHHTGVARQGSNVLVARMLPRPLLLLG